MEYKARCGVLTPAQLAAFDQTGYSEKFIRLLVQRGIDTKEKATEFFNFDPAKLHDPFLLKGMTAAVERLKAAILRKERILIIGDYDADGICATAILYQYLCSKRVKTSYFLPERDADGYGLNIDLVQKLYEKYQPNLLITVDCGISCPAEITCAQELGVDCIVTDHHTVPAEYPHCICVDPKFPDQEYPFDDLCGAGVALKLIQAMDGLATAQKYFDVCAIATVADIVSLTDENRVIVHHGLRMLNQGTIPGITALAKACNIRDEIKSSDISFRLGPKINASGRMGNAKRGLDVILERDPARIEHIIKNLLYLNTKRQELCTKIYDECLRTINENQLQTQPALILARPDWESGVLGIVAARLTEKYGKPSLVFGGKGEIYKGSGRSVPGINLVEVITQAKDLLQTYGGHAMAAGLSLTTQAYPAFVEKMQALIAEKTATQTIDADKYYDFEISSEELTDQFCREVQQLEPTGCGNPVPVFMTVLRQAQATSLVNHPTHTKFDHGKMKFIFFGGAGFNEILAAQCEKSIIFELQLTADNAAKAIVKCVIPFAINDEEQAMVLQRYLVGDLVVSPDQTLQKIIAGLSLDREVFIQYYKAISLLVRRNAAFPSIIQLFHKLDLHAKNIFQFVFCFSVFEQLGILQVSRQTLKINNQQTTELNKSIIYQKISQKNQKE